MYKEGQVYRVHFLIEHRWKLKSEKDLRIVLEVAAILRELRTQNISPRVFDSGLAISNFRDNSTRTRFSFASASNLLGLAVADLDEEKSQIAHGETVRETANMISFLAEVIGIKKFFLRTTSVPIRNFTFGFFSMKQMEDLCTQGSHAGPSADINHFPFGILDEEFPIWPADRYFIPWF